jgi:hypothetical protein
MVVSFAQRCAALIAVGALVSASWTAAAFANGSPPPRTNVPAIAQYVESQPTFSGSKPSISGLTATGSAPVSKKTTAAISAKGGADAQALLGLVKDGQRPARTSSATQRLVARPSPGAIIYTGNGAGISLRDALILGLVLAVTSAICGFAAVRRRLGKRGYPTPA